MLYRCTAGWSFPGCNKCKKDFVGEGHCTIPCIGEQGIYKHPLEGSGGTTTLEAYSVCIANNGTENETVWFGYENTNDHIIELGYGPHNHFIINGKVFIQLAGMPTVFYPGKHQYIFNTK